MNYPVHGAKPSHLIEMTRFSPATKLSTLNCLTYNWVIKVVVKNLEMIPLTHKCMTLTLLA
jgi:hypothetical protein